MAFTQPTIASVPNVDAITQTLAKLQPDSALQQYAAMHKNDPYILSLATAESNRRKALRTAAQGSVGQQPTVADQEIAGMAPAPAQLPENQGIGRLATPNIQRMADGGIAGYDEGGMAGGPASQLEFQNEPVIRMAGGGMPKYSGKGSSLVRTTNGGKSWFLDVPSTIRDPSVPHYREIPNPLAELANMEFPSRAAAEEAYNVASTKYQSAPGRAPYNVVPGSAAPTVDNRYIDNENTTQLRNLEGDKESFGEVRTKDSRTNQRSTFAGPDAPIVPRWTPAAGALAASAQSTPAAPSAPSAPPAPADAPAAAGADTGGPSLKNTPTPMNTGLGSLNTMVGDARKRFLRDANSTIPEAQSIEDILAARKAMMPQGKAMEGYEASLKKEEAEEPVEKEKAGLMALTQGFLAVAAGESPNALTNIAKGLGVGLKDYGDALKDFKKAGKERQKQMAEIEMARRAEERGDVDKASSLYESAQDREQRRRASIDSGLASLEAHGISGAYSLAGHEISGKYSLAGHQLSANAQKEWMKEIKGGQLVETAMKDLRAQIAKSNKYGTPEEQEAEFQKRWPEMLQMNPNLAKYAGSTGGSAAVDTTGFKVLR